MEASAHMGFDFPWEIVLLHQLFGANCNRDIDLEESVEQVHDTHYAWRRRLKWSMIP